MAAALSTVGSRNLKSNEVDKFSAMKAFALIDIESLKVAAQSLRERLDWGIIGMTYEQSLYTYLMEVIKISCPEFDTHFQPVN